MKKSPKKLVVVDGVIVDHCIRCGQIAEYGNSYNLRGGRVAHVTCPTVAQS